MASPLLLVADDLSLIAAVKRALARDGQDCRLATSAADAVIAFGNELPALVLLQPEVESGRGQVVLEELMGHPEAALLRVVLLGSQLPGQELPVEPLPIDPRHFLATIEAQRRGGAEAVASSSARKTLPPVEGEPPPGTDPEANTRQTWPPATTAAPPPGRRTWPPPGAGPEGRRTPVGTPEPPRRGTWPPPEPAAGTSPSGTRRARTTPVGTTEPPRRRTWPPPEGAEPGRPTWPEAQAGDVHRTWPPEGAPAAAAGLPDTLPPRARETWPPGQALADTWPKGQPSSGEAAAPTAPRTTELSLLDTARVEGGTLPPLTAEPARPTLPGAPGETLPQWGSFTPAAPPRQTEELFPPFEPAPTPAVPELSLGPGGPADTADEEAAEPPPTAPAPVQAAAAPAEPPARRRVITTPLFPTPPEAPAAPAPGPTPAAAPLAERLVPALQDEVARDVEAEALASLEASLAAPEPPPATPAPARRIPTPAPALPGPVLAALSRAEALVVEGRERARPGGAAELAAEAEARAAAEGRAAELEAERQRLEVELLEARAAQARVAGLEAELVEAHGAEERAAALEADRDRLEAALREARPALERLPALEARVAELEPALAEARSAQARAEAAVGQSLSEQGLAWQQHLAEAEAAAAQAQARAAELQVRLEEAEQGLTELARRRDEKVAELTRQREERLQELNRQQGETISELTRRHDERVGELRRELAEAQAAAEIARGEAAAGAEVEGRLEAEHQAHDATRRSLLEAEARLAALQSEVGLVEQARDEAERRQREAEGALEQAEAARAAAAAQAAGLGSELASARDFVEEAGLQRSQLEADLAALKSALAEARSQVASQEQEKASLREELERAAARQAAAVKELAQLKDALDEARTRAEQAEATASLAHQKLEEQERRAVVSLALPGERSLGVPRHGELDLQGLARLVSQLVLAEANTSLELGAPGGTRTLWLKGGQLVAAASTFPGEGLIERARQDGLIDGRQEAELRLFKGGTVREQLESLKGRRLIRDAEAVPLVQRHAEALALEALSEPSSQYRLGELAPGPEVTLVTFPRPTLPLLAEALRRALDPDTLLERLGGGDAVVHPTDAELDLRSLGFSDRERRMLSRVDGQSTVETLALESGLRAENAFRTLAVAQLLGLVATQAPEAPRTTGDPELDARRLLAKYDQVVDADYFSILGLARGAGTDEVRRAFERLSQEFHPLRFSGHPDLAVQERAHLVFRSLQEAAEALGDDERRAEYARHLLD